MKKQYFLHGIVFAVSIDFIFSLAFQNFMLLNLYFLAVSAYLFIINDETINIFSQILFFNILQLTLFIRTEVDYLYIYILTIGIDLSIYFNSIIIKIINPVIIIFFYTTENEFKINGVYFNEIYCGFALFFLVDIFVNQKKNIRVLWFTSFFNYAVLFIRSNGLYCISLSILFIIALLLILISASKIMKITQITAPLLIATIFGIVLGIIYIYEGFNFKKNATIKCHVLFLYFYILINSYINYKQ